jgi:hypothetical protein
MEGVLFYDPHYSLPDAIIGRDLLWSSNACGNCKKILIAAFLMGIRDGICGIPF